MFLPEFNYEEISDKPKWKDILQNNWPVISKSFKVMNVNTTVAKYSINERD